VRNFKWEVARSAISDRTVGNILRRHNIAPAPDRSRTRSWKEFIRSHMEVLAAADFLTVEVLKWRGLVTYYIRFFHRSRHPPRACNLLCLEYDPRAACSLSVTYTGPVVP
jgi:hypothetical protein